jgi:hypothetical protein
MSLTKDYYVPFIEIKEAYEVNKQEDFRAFVKDIILSCTTDMKEKTGFNRNALWYCSSMINSTGPTVALT